MALLIKLIKSKNLKSTSFENWEKIDSYEKKNAVEPAPRKKILTIKEAADAVESHLEEEAEKLLKEEKN